MRSFYGMTLLNWVICTAHHHHHLYGNGSNRITVQGGVPALADALGFGRSKRAPKLLREALTIGQFISHELWDGNGLWLFEEHQNPEDRRQKIAYITLAVGLTPEAPYLGQKGLLTPMVRFAQTSGNKKYAAATARFQLAMLQELSDGSRQFAAKGGVLLTQEILVRRALQADLPAKSIHPTIESWVQGDADVQLLERVGRDRFHLADNHEFGPARAMLEEQCTLRESRSRSGKRSSQVKQHAIRSRRKRPK